jgi:4-hydroxy-2-oxoheptanedioate aldolase
MRHSRIKAKLRRGELAMLVTCHFIDPSIYEMTSLMGFDGIWLDLEHHTTSAETANELMRAARVGASDVIVRPAKGEFLRMGRLLEAGAQGVMYPRCETADEAAEVVRWAKFAPQGQRGIDGANPDNPYCFMPMAPYLTAANEHTLMMVQIESPGAVDQAEAIARVPGVDVLFVGPGDLSVLAGVPFQFNHPIVEDALRRVADAAKRAGKWWGTPCFSPEHGRKLLDMGARLIAHGADIILLKQGFERIQDQFATLGFNFDNRLAAEAAAMRQGERPA